MLFSANKINELAHDMCLNGFKMSLAKKNPTV